MKKHREFNQELSKISPIISTDPDNPKLRFPIIETHCHLDYLLNPDGGDSELESLINQSKKLGIEKIITICVSPNNMDLCLNIANKFEDVFCTQGIHPHEALNWHEQLIPIITKRAQEKKVVAIGEIGLDYHYQFSPREKQIEVFEKQLDLACEISLPVVIHTREADEDTISILRNFDSRLKKKGVLHSYTSGKKLAELSLELGFYIGFNGIITFKNAQNVRDILQIVPLNKLLLETDAPYLTPHPFRGKKNSPLYLPFIAEKILEEKKEKYDTLLPILYKNSLDLFQLNDSLKKNK